MESLGDDREICLIDRCIRGDLSEGDLSIDLIIDRKIFPPRKNFRSENFSGKNFPRGKSFREKFSGYFFPGGKIFLAKKRKIFREKFSL